MRSAGIPISSKLEVTIPILEEVQVSASLSPPLYIYTQVRPGEGPQGRPTSGELGGRRCFWTNDALFTFMVILCKPKAHFREPWGPPPKVGGWFLRWFLLT